MEGGFQHGGPGGLIFSTSYQAVMAPRPRCSSDVVASRRAGVSERDIPARPKTAQQSAIEAGAAV